MTLLLKQLFAFFKMLNSETGTNQLSWGLALGFVLGFSPLFSLQGILVILICLFFRVQMGAAFLAGSFFTFIAFLVDPLADQMGRWILEQEGLRSYFVQLANMPIIPWTRFNNSLVMGSGAIGFVLSIPAFFLFRYLIVQYREKVVAKFKKSKFWKALSATSFYKWYVKYEELYG